MRMLLIKKYRLVFLSFAIMVILGSGEVFAHCDGMDGPVVLAAQKALATGNVKHVLIWVQKGDEAVIRNAFQQTLAVRKVNAEARELADRYFFETLVRIHRAGEGAPYMGLKPAGRDLGPAIAVADQAIENGAVEHVLKLVSDAVRHGIQEKFNHVRTKKTFNLDNVEAGREYAKAYVSFVHYVNCSMRLPVISQ